VCIYVCVCVCMYVCMFALCLAVTKHANTVTVPAITLLPTVLTAALQFRCRYERQHAVAVH
jgi:hypothetical protein